MACLFTQLWASASFKGRHRQLLRVRSLDFLFFDAFRIGGPADLFLAIAVMGLLVPLAWIWWSVVVASTEALNVLLITVPGGCGARKRAER